MEGFERYKTWNKWLKEIPALEEQINGIIARSIILTNGNLEEVEFVTSASKTDIFQVYQWLDDKGLLSSDGVKQEENEEVHEEMATVSKRSKRTFTREEMVDFTKRKLLESNSNIKFVGLKHNILTCNLNDETFKIYLSMSRDFEFTRKAPDQKPYRVSAWNKGSSSIFSSCDYYAFLVKVDNKSKYITESDEEIEGVFVSKSELNIWLNKKTSVPSGMINFYVHYSQVPGEGRASIKVIDDREEPPISLNDLFKLGWRIR